MVTFTRTPVRSVRTLGDHIRSARFAHGLTLDDVAGVLVIQKKHLERIENNEFGAFHEEVYVENVLRAYSTYLGFVWDEIRDLYRASRPLYASVSNNQTHQALLPKIHASHFWVTPHIVRKGLFAFIITACFFYIIFLGYRMMSTPELLIVSPRDNSLSAVDTIEVVGRVDTRAQVAINGEWVAKSEEGVFHQIVGLQEGVNIITVTAAKKFGQSRSEDRTVIFSQQPFDESKRSEHFQQALSQKKP